MRPYIFEYYSNILPNINGHKPFHTELLTNLAWVVSIQNCLIRADWRIPSGTLAGTDEIKISNCNKLIIKLIRSFITYCINVIVSHNLNPGVNNYICALIYLNDFRYSFWYCLCSNLSTNLSQIVGFYVFFKYQI